jgi:hypothetical protein
MVLLFLTGAKQSVFSDVILNQNHQPALSLSESQYISFFNHHITGRTKDSASDTEIAAHHPDPSTCITGSGAVKDLSVKDKEAVLKIEAVIIFRWKVIQELLLTSRTFKSCVDIAVIAGRIAQTRLGEDNLIFVFCEMSQSATSVPDYKASHP